MNIRVTTHVAAGGAATISALTAAAAIAGLGGPLMACLAILAVLICPGAAPAISLRPWLGAGEAAVAAVGSSVSLAAVTGVLMYAVGIDLTRTSLAIGLALVTVLGAALVIWLTPRGGNGWSISLRFRRSGWIAAAIATLLLAGTVVVTVRGVDSAEASLGFTQVWAGSAMDSAVPTINVRNHEGRPERYVVKLKSDGRVVHSWAPFSLSPSQTWTAAAGRPINGTRLIAIVERARPDDRGRQTINLTP